jgi:hypothetical protein
MVLRRNLRHAITRQTVDVQDAFGYVLFAVVAVGAIAAVVAFVLSGKAYEQIGKGGFFKDDDAPRRTSGGPIDLAERDDEIRQMLTARNARRAQAGREMVDVEAELARLTQPAQTHVDPALRAEIRELVIARNARRERRGEEPLDVDEEVERQVRELGGGA